MTRGRSVAKAEETEQRIREAALELFRRDGFESATMRGIAERAGVATGAAYYYYASKEALVLDFYRRTWAGMQEELAEAVRGGRGLEGKLRAVIGVKLAAFGPNREVLRALLRNGADPRHVLSPFGRETGDIRSADIGWFARVVEESGVRVPADVGPHLPGVLWFFQMGIIFYWVLDESAGQERTGRLVELGTKSVAGLVKLAGLPFLRPVRKTVVELIELVKAGAM